MPCHGHRYTRHPAAQITDVADSQAGGEQISWQNGIHQSPDGTHPQGQQQLEKDKTWQPPARSAAWGMRVSAADIDLNSLQYIGERSAVAASDGRTVPSTTQSCPTSRAQKTSLLECCDPCGRRVNIAI